MVAGRKSGCNRAAFGHMGWKLSKKAIAKIWGFRSWLSAFSTENWHALKMKSVHHALAGRVLWSFRPRIASQQCQDSKHQILKKLPKETLEALKEQKRWPISGLILNFALNYGGRVEIVPRPWSRSPKKSWCEVQSRRYHRLDDRRFSLYRESLPSVLIRDPDLIIRTSGDPFE